MLGFIKRTDKSQGSSDLELQMLQGAMDNVDSMVMLCDTTPDNVIFYMNRTARELLSRLRHDLNARFRPGVDVERAMQHSIHQFHKNPDHNRRILADLASRRIQSHSALIPVGDITFETNVYAIFGQDDPSHPLCFMASFRDISARQKNEQLTQDNERRRQFLEERVGELSQNMQGMSATIENVAVQTSAASDSAEVMLKESRQGMGIVEETSRSMRTVAGMVRNTADSLVSLGKRSETIGQIVNVIKDIADQTNLLALNAAIEAARAGETGRGFAVVADEVRKLAERTTKATQEIGSMIRDIQVEVQQNVTAIEEGREQVQATEQDFQRAEEALTKIVSEVNQMRDFVVQIAQASEEQAATSQDISDKLADIVAGHLS